MSFILNTYCVTYSIIGNNQEFSYSLYQDHHSDLVQDQIEDYIIRYNNLQSVSKIFINFHYSGFISASITVIRS